MFIKFIFLVFNIMEDGRAGGERLARLARSARHQDSDLQGVPRSPEMATVKTPETR